MLAKLFDRIAYWSAYVLGTWQAFILATAMCLIWGLSGPVFDYSDTWQLVINTATTVLTFLAVFLIQNAQNRQESALHLKLDELIRKLEGPDDRLAGIEHPDAELPPSDET